MNQNAIIVALLIAIILGVVIYTFVFRKPEPESKPEVVFEEEVEEPSPDAVDEVMTGGDDEPIPEEDETSLETAPVDGEIVEEAIEDQNDVVEGYMIKK